MIVLYNYTNLKEEIMKKKLVSVLLVSTMVMTMLVGCGKNSNTGEESKNEGVENQAKTETFVQAVNSVPISLDPIQAYGDETTIARNAAYDVLFYSIKGEREYRLAEKLDISEDGLVYTLHVNKDANWSDGKPVVVDDITFFIDYYKKANGYNNVLTVEGKPVTITKIDDKTLEFKLPLPYLGYESHIGQLIPLPSHIFDNDISKIEGTDYFSKPGMATSGAYVVEEFNQDSILYTARDDYYRGKAPIEEVVIKSIGAGSTQQVAFNNGEISYMRITNAEDLEKYSSNDKYNVCSMSEARVNVFQINPNGQANLTDEQREAIFTAIDQEEIISAAYGSKELAIPANSFLTPDQDLYNKDCEGYKFDLEKAKKLAESSGLTEKTLIYIYNKDRANMEEVATVIQQQLARINVKVQVEGYDAATFLPKHGYQLMGGEIETSWDLATNGWDSQRGAGLGQVSMWTTPAFGFGEETQKLTGETITSGTYEAGKDVAYKLQDQLYKDYYIYPLVYTNYVMVSQKNFSGLDSCPIVPEFADYLKIKAE